MGGKEVRITYDTLFELLRREKEKKELQKLDASFFKDVLSYFKDKQEILSKIDSYSEEEADRIKSQIHNAKRLLKGIYDKREQKIIEKAIIKARTGSNIITTENMLDEEKVLFNELISLLSRFRKNLLVELLNGREIHVEVKKEEKKEKANRQIVRFLDYIPKFVGIDGKVYGPYAREEVAVLPSSIVKLLLDNEKAEVINEEEKKQKEDS